MKNITFVLLYQKEKKKMIRIRQVLLVGTAFIGCAFFGMAQLSPTPQQCKTGERTYTRPEAFLLNGILETDTTNRRLAESLLPAPAKRQTYWRLTIGERGDRSVRAYAKKIPQQAEGYYLAVKDKEIIVAGNDERGTLYGLCTLRQLLQKPELQSMEITDWPDVAMRGIVEGYYGTPMDYATHLRMLQYYGQHKMNIYLYGPKDDPYHSTPHWRQPYPAKEAAEIREMNRVARQNGIDFVWAIHPGKDIRWNTADRDSVMMKFEAMYGLGIRSFALFFDDISGEGAKAEKQVELLNYLDDHFIHAKGDVKPLIFCPTEYNKAWSDPDGGYLKTLGDKLNKDIAVMWTGNSVICNIQPEDMEWINDRIQRKALVWWNYPVTDYVRDHVLMGPVYGNSLELADHLAGFVSNPMEHAEASKVAVGSIADYVWNMKAFDSDASWNNALKELLPKNTEALKLFAEHNCDTGPNVHLFRRDESVRIQPVLDEFLQSVVGGTVSFNEGKVRSEFENIIEAADLLMADCENPYLLQELMPWYRPFKLLGEMGVEAMNLYKAWQDQYQEGFLKSYRHLRALQYLAYQYDQETFPDAPQPGVKTGSAVLRPFVDKLFTHLVDAYNHRFGATLATTLNYSNISFVSDVPQLKNLAVTFRNGNKVTLSQLNEVLKWGDKQSLTLSLEKAMPAIEFRLDLGIYPLEGLTFEVENEQGEWEKAELPHSWSTVYLAQFGGRTVKGIRLTNTSGHTIEGYLRTGNLILRQP